MNKITILLGVILVTTVSFGQRKSIADRFFNEFAYVKSAELYEKIYNKGDDSQEVLGRLGDSYYYNADFLQAEKWYKQLFDTYENTVNSGYIFRYAQTLKSNGKVKESDKWILKLNKIKKDDSRVSQLEKNLDYFVEYTNKKQTYINVNNLSVNTKYSDFGGFIFNNELYYSSTKPIDAKDKRLYKWNNQPHLNIYKAKEDFDLENDILDVKEELRITSLSSLYHESNAVITSDNKTMYFTRTNSENEELKQGENKEANLKIYKAENIDGKWSNITSVSFNNDDYSTGHPALSPDEKTLYFVSNMPNGFGLTDLYKVTILEDGSFSKPQNLGDKINTEGREMFPFVGEDETLYFASDGHLGLGALDVLEAKKVNETYTNPVNLGPPVNSPYDDFSFVINKKRNNGFFSSNRKKGKGDDDIYSFIVDECKIDVSGKVLDKNTNQLVENALVKLVDAEGIVLAEKKTKSDGSYAFGEVDCEKEFSIVVTKEDHKGDNKTMTSLDEKEEKIEVDLKVEGLIVEDEIVISPIYFDFDQHDIREDAASELDHVVSVMKNHPTMVIKIESHTDSRGERNYNKLLSDKRAKSTRDYIVSKGISFERIESAIGYGEAQLLNNCNDENEEKCTKEEHQKNRRSYFYIIKK
ncbi:OmpA family protein [Tenacibaculum insulae]|uniref:OmpA family protein n=1 Tax=Tenacibaculum insulae TaxID=2029677 RepID=UPI003AB4054F